MPAPCISTVLGSPINSACVSQIVGVEKDAILVPASLIDRATLAFDSGTVIVNTFELISGNGQKVTVKGDLPYKETVINGTQGEYVQLYESTFAFPILENSPDAAKQLMQLGNDHYVAIVQFKGYTAAKKNKYGIIGLNRGLHFATANLSMESQDAFGWKVELKEMEGLVPIHFLWAAAGETATDAIFAGLLPA
jgi:hypothetical protein